MPNTRQLCFLRILVIGLIALSPAMAQAGGAFIIKGGVARLADDTQMVGSTQLTMDESSSRAIAINVEGRKHNGMAFGGEYLTYRHDYSFPVSQTGEARTQTLQFLAKKYFIKDGLLHPYIGIGIGFGWADITSSAGLTSDIEVGIGAQALVGIELRFDNLSFQAEVKQLYFDIDGSGNNYDPTATGAFVGLGFNW